MRSRDGFDRLVDRRPAWAELRRQGFRFVLVGGIVAGIYVGTTTFLAEVIGVPFEVSLAIGFALAIVTHFSLQRLYVWRQCCGVRPRSASSARSLSCDGRASIWLDRGDHQHLAARLGSVARGGLSTNRGSDFCHEFPHLSLADLPRRNRSAASISESVLIALAWPSGARSPGIPRPRCGPVRRIRAASGGWLLVELLSSRRHRAHGPRNGSEGWRWDAAVTRGPPFRGLSVYFVARAAAANEPRRADLA